MMHVITGGSGSGKSAYAEMWLTGKPEKSEEKKSDMPISVYCDHASIWCRRHKRRLNATGRCAPEKDFRRWSVMEI